MHQKKFASPSKKENEDLVQPTDEENEGKKQQVETGNSNKEQEDTAEGSHDESKPTKLVAAPGNKLKTNTLLKKRPIAKTTLLKSANENPKAIIG